MNRTERRNKEKTDRKVNNKTIEAMKWINSLSPERMNLIKNVLNNESKQEQKHIIQAIERCYTAGIIEVLEDAITIADIEKIMEKCSELLVEDAKKINVEKQKCGGDYEMAVKKINAIANEVANRIEELIGEGINPKELSKAISFEYPTLTKAMITNSIKRVREELKEVKNLKKVITREEGEEKLLEILGADDNAEVILGATEVIDEIIKSAKEDEFEIISEVKIIDLKGKHATYHIENNVMQVNNDLAFCNEKEVSEWASDEIAKIKLKEKEAIRVLEKFM